MGESASMIYPSCSPNSALWSQVLPRLESIPSPHGIGSVLGQVALTNSKALSPSAISPQTISSSTMGSFCRNHPSLIRICRSLSSSKSRIMLLTMAIGRTVNGGRSHDSPWRGHHCNQEDATQQQAPLDQHRLSTVSMDLGIHLTGR